MSTVKIGRRGGRMTEGRQDAKGEPTSVRRLGGTEGTQRTMARTSVSNTGRSEPEGKGVGVGRETEDGSRANVWTEARRDRERRESEEGNPGQDRKSEPM